MIFSTLSGQKVVKHPTLPVLCREDGAVLLPKSGNRTSPTWTYGGKRKDGYMRVFVLNKERQVHRLILEAFCPNVDVARPYVDHINRDKSDNRLLNLRWVSASENARNTKAYEECEAKWGVHKCSDPATYKKAYLHEYYTAHREYAIAYNKEYRRKRKCKK